MLRRRSNLSKLHDSFVKPNFGGKTIPFEEEGEW